jgi:acetyltransferase-like isoleucine patch superfamily enzyme
VNDRLILGKGSKIDGKETIIGKSIQLGENVIITGRTITIEDNVTIGDNVRIQAENIVIGFNSKIERNCEIVMPEKRSEFRVGDNFYLGNDSRIFTPVLKVGDYVTIHNHALLYGVNSCVIGHNFWAGQNCTFNSNESLIIGNGVGIGTYSSVWTHGFFGELLEGCKVFKIAPTIIEDDVWILGAYNVISPGIRLGKRSLIMTGSVVTKDVEPYHCVAGNPAKDITNKIIPYQEPDMNSKLSMMGDFIAEFLKLKYPDCHTKSDIGWNIEKGRFKWEIILAEKFTGSVGDNIQRLYFVKSSRATPDKLTTVFNLSSKTYTKRRTVLEIEIIKFLFSYRARFIPI